MFSKKHYVAVAEALKVAKSQSFHAVNSEYQPELNLSKAIIDKAFEKTIEQLSLIFEIDNPSSLNKDGNYKRGFDAEKFKQRATLRL
jgi:hypothetical protein